MNTFSKTAAVLLFSGLAFSSAVMAASPRDEAKANCEKEAIDNEVDMQDRDDYVRGCMAELGFNSSVSGEDAVEESKPANSSESEDRG